MVSLCTGGELSEKKARRLKKHLEVCSDCRETAEEFRAALSGYRAAVRQQEFDWPEAEWKKLMHQITTQPAPRPVTSFQLIPKRAWSYGVAALLMLAGLTAFVVLRTGLLRRVPVLPIEILSSTEVQPSRPLDFAESHFPRLRQDVPFLAQVDKPRALESETLIAVSAGEKTLQDMLSMTLVSQETGLKVLWTFNRNFEWKEEEKQ
jgi:hypothetical protein